MWWFRHWLGKDDVIGFLCGGVTNAYLWCVKSKQIDNWVPVCSLPQCNLMRLESVTWRSKYAQIVKMFYDSISQIWFRILSMQIGLRYTRTLAESAKNHQQLSRLRTNTTPAHIRHHTPPPIITPQQKTVFSRVPYRIVLECMPPPTMLLTLLF